MARTVADVMVAALKASGVRRVYGIPGDSVNGFMDALRRDGEITWEHVRHEEAAGFAAAAEAAVTGQLAVCAGSCGPGNLHLINGLFDANRSRVQVLTIAAQIPREEIGGNYFQETRRGGEHQPVLLPQRSRRRAKFGMAPQLPMQRLDGDLRDPQRPARPVRLRVPVRADRPPHRDCPGVQVHVIPCKGPRLLGPAGGRRASSSGHCAEAAAGPRTTIAMGGPFRLRVHDERQGGPHG
jgi:hypothetical protein